MASALSGRIRRARSRPQGLEKCDNLPALRFRQFRPYRHSVPDDSVRQDPKKSAGCRSRHGIGEQTWAIASSAGFWSMTLRTMLFEEFAPSLGLPRISFQRIPASPSRRRNLLQRSIDVAMGFLLCTLALLRDRDGNRDAKHGCDKAASIKPCRNPLPRRISRCFHGRPPNKCLISSPKPENSRDIPQRSKRRWLLSFRPNPLDRRSVQSDGRFHATTGAR